MKKLVAVALFACLSVSAGAALAAAKKTAAPKTATKASKADCEKGLANMYKVSGTDPNDESKKDNEAKCEKEYSKAMVDCMGKAKSIDDLGACKGK